MNKECEYFMNHVNNIENCKEINDYAFHKCKDYKPEHDELEQLFEMEKKAGSLPYTHRLFKAIIDHIKKLESK